MADLVTRWQGPPASAPGVRATVERQRFGERARALSFGVLAAAVLIVLIAIGSRGFH